MSTQSHTVSRHRAGSANHASRGGDSHSLVESATGDVQHLLDNVRERVAHIKERTSEAIDGTERAVKQHPWTAIGVALGAGVLIGMFMRRR